MDDLLVLVTIRGLIFVLGSLSLLWALRHLVPNLVGYWRDRNYKSATIAVVAIITAVTVLWYLVPPSQKTARRTALEVTYKEGCKQNTKYKSCESHTNCTQCMTTHGCFETVDKYYSLCFYQSYTEPSPRSYNLIPALSACMNEHAGCEYFGHK
jgi:hypothetical protein